jgi:hypothetical protein
VQVMGDAKLKVIAAELITKVCTRIQKPARGIHIVMILTSHALETMGFRELAEGEQVVAAFYSVHVYGVQGLTVDDDTVLPFQGEVSGAGYTGALGKRVNALALALSSHDRFTDDEEAWAKEQKCTPPYVLVQFGPSKQHSCTGGHIKDEGPSLTTYDCFSSARDELRANETKVLPSLISALTCRFGSAVQIHPHSRV